MPVLGLPLLLVGLAALPMVAGIYWLRTRFRRQEVSTLFLWQSAVEAQGGGRKKSRFQTPLTLLLELLAIALLVLAATAPRVLRAGQTVALTVVLDDSYSMRAIDGVGVSSRDRALETLRQELKGLPRYAARLMTAGKEPQVLGEPGSNWAEIEAMLQNWRCEAASSDIDGALALASEISGPRGRLLVLSDHEMPAHMRSPTESQSGAIQEAEAVETAEDSGAWGRLRWLAVGQPRDNVAVINAVRSSRTDEAEDVLLIELINHGDEISRPSLTLSVGSDEINDVANPSTTADGETLTIIDKRQIELVPGQIMRLWLRPTQAAGRPVVVTLSDDALTADNQVVLMPIDSPPLGVSVELQDPKLRRAITQAVEASGRAVVVNQGAGLIFTDQPDDENTLLAQKAWTVYLDRGSASAQTKEAQAFLGPFVIDRSHPLTEGLSLVGLVWSVAPREVNEPANSPSEIDNTGRPLVTAGNEVLLRDEIKPGAGRLLTWRLWPERSTVMQSAAFPILIWNIIEWRRADRPGVSPVNVRPGVPISITTAATQGEVRIRRIPGDGVARDTAGLDTPTETLTMVDRRAVFSPDSPGVYEILTADERYRVAVNGGSETESNLRTAATDEFGQWNDAVAIEREYQGLGWALGLAVLVILGTHAWWVGRGGAGVFSKNRADEISRAPLASNPATQETGSSHNYGTGLPNAGGKR